MMREGDITNSSTLSSSASMISSLSSVSTTCKFGEEVAISLAAPPRPQVSFSQSLPGLTRHQRAAGFNNLWQLAKPDSQLQFSSSYPACQIKFSTEDEVTDNTEEEIDAAREDTISVR